MLVNYEKIKGKMYQIACILYVFFSSSVKQLKSRNQYYVKIIAINIISKITKMIINLDQNQ